MRQSWIILLFVCTVCLNADAMRIQAGGGTLKLPCPEGFVLASLDFPKQVELLPVVEMPPSRILAVFIPEEDARQLRASQGAGLEEYLVVSAYREGAHVEEGEFNSVRDCLNALKVKRALRNRETESTRSVSLSAFIRLPIRGSKHKSETTAVTLSMILIHGQVFRLDAYAVPETDKNLRWTRALVLPWIRDVLEANSTSWISYVPFYRQLAGQSLKKMASHPWGLLVISIFLALCLGISLPCVFRFFIVRHRVSSPAAFLFSAANTVGGGCLFDNWDTPDNPEGAWICIFAVSYLLLRIGTSASELQRSRDRMERKRREMERRKLEKRHQEEQERKNAEEKEKWQKSVFSSSEEKHYGAILGLHGSFQPEEVKQSHRKLVVQWHPDLVAHLGEAERQEAERKIKEINEAYNYFKRKYGF